MAIDRSSDTSTALFDLMTSQRITAVIYVAAKLGIADILAEGPKTSPELARQTGAHERSLSRLLRALVTVGICRPAGKDQFALTEIGAHLAGNAQGSLKAWAIFEGEWLWLNWGGLLESIQTGKTAAEIAGFKNSFEQTAQNAQRVKVFNDAMVAMTRRVSPAVIAAFDFSAIKYLIDVGGGHGELMGGILKANPAMRGAVYDLPQCGEGAKRLLADAGVGNRCEFIGGNFFESVPSGADAIVMKSIIHDWNDERSIVILRNCRQALPPNGRLLLVERAMPDVAEAKADHRDAALSDLNMMRGPGGSERTESEYRELLAKGGFKMTRVVPAGRMSVIEAS
jgi:SAM-dependent methyltransferase